MIRQFVYLAIGIIIGADESLQACGPFIGMAGALLQLFAMMNSTLRNLGYGLAALMMYAGFLVAVPNDGSYPSHDEIKDCQCTGIVEQVKRSPYSTRLLLRDAQCQHPEKSFSTAGVMITLRDSLTHVLQTGAVITTKATLTPVKVSDSPLDSDYPKYLLRKRIFFTAKVKNENLTNTGETSDQWSYRVARLRQNLLTQVDALGMEANTSGVMKALLFGDTEDIPQDILTHYAASGTIHVLAVSGMHVALIYMVLAPLFKRMFKHRRHRLLRYGIPILILWGYAGITGFSASVMRASTMFSLILTAAIAGRKPNGLNVLFGAGWLMCVMDAMTLFDLGFQLSFSAVGGILILEKKLRTSIELKHYIPRKLWEMSSVSIAAQIGTMPVALFYFHQFPLYFLPANLIIVPLSTVALYAGIILFTLSGIGMQLSILNEITALLLTSMNELTGFFSRLPLCVIDDIQLNFSDLACFSFFLVLIIRYILWRSQRALLFTCAFLIFMETKTIILSTRPKPIPSQIHYRNNIITTQNHSDTLVYLMPKGFKANDRLVQKIKIYSTDNGYKTIKIQFEK
jgi:competence protein ComEC